MELQSLNPYSFADKIEGLAISEEMTVPEDDTELYIKELFIEKMDTVFETAPKKGCDIDDDGLYYFKYGVKEYIWSLYPLYVEILNTEVRPDPFELGKIFPDRASESDCYDKIAKFVVAVKSKRLRQGGCVDRYVKGLPYIPYFAKRLLKVQKNRYFLQNSDTENIDYKLAVLTSVKFMNPEHTRLFELKAMQFKIERFGDIPK